MSQDRTLALGRLLRRPGRPGKIDGFTGVEVHDPRLAAVISPEAEWDVLYTFTLHGEGTVWDPPRDRLIWSDVPNRRLLAWYPDGRVEVAIDNTQFMNGNALGADGYLVHCEHGRRCVSRSDGDGQPEPIVTHYDGKRLNSPNDVTVAADGAIWFTDPTFGILMPNQGSLVDPDLDHRSVYRFDPRAGSLRRMADFEQPNDLFFSPDGRRLYVSDTARSLGEIIGGHERDTHEILVFDVAADGTLSNQRLFCRADHGYPDGFAVDERGWVWTTAGDGIHIYASDGIGLGFIPTPDTPSNCAFGGPAQRRLFVAATSYLLSIELIA
ncbi:SMP-30/gluconolactonase/LRE family protein [Methylobacterium sp. J-077]|uniref:SMP-30/gluconolactonase/LRE family protein n=1 Tax=Methylobacterium sp. J-077 TaxID=2836656 RepID=UPI001FBB3F97|nr:SMP-30/gluconolactonase/LRE family protein [Methylobacterium sp. J-077]MCJ2125733.1 SMP-30/gluconolactonase/LRE family protein [Methylobacterium sp. J-077]